MWVKIIISQIVITNFVNIQFFELFKMIFENLHLKKTHMRGSPTVEINTIFNKEYFASSIRKDKSSDNALMYVKNDI